MRLQTHKIKKNYSDMPEGDGSIDSQDWIKNTLEITLNDFEFGIANEHAPRLEEIEYQSRDGFIPYSHNKGGFDKTQFTTLQDIWGSGNRYSGALDKGIQEAIDHNLKNAVELFVEQNPEVLFNGLNEGQINYHDLYEAGLGEYAELLSEYEYENLSDDYSSVMEQIRIMYHGEQDGVHSLTVFASVSYTDAPYHRGSDAVKERLITFKTETELKKKLLKALEITSKVFS